ncbi:MAG: prolyl oligopeptidase family serine peptidase [Opitutaceae bacterium]|nr:prolyl oligopeptidase family serine peptidase [Opitutaceae bacterium]
MRTLALLVLLLTGLVSPAVRAADTPAPRLLEKRVEGLFRPPAGERSALSLDGKFMAYTQHAPGELLIIILDLERRVVTARISADEDRPILHSREKRRARLRYLEWTEGSRLIFAPEIEIIGPPVKTPLPDTFLLSSAEETGSRFQVPPLEPTVIAPVMAVDHDGRNPLQLADAKTFQTMRTDPSAADMPPRMRRAPPLIRGFAAGDRTHLLVEIQGYTGYGAFPEMIPTKLFRVHVRTGKITEAHSEPGNGQIAYDLAGQPRLARESKRGQGSAFLARAPDSGRWTKLPEPPGAGPQGSFAVTPETYFGERAIPLGFDADPAVMIYASNAGRDTFGVYGVNLKTRQRTELSLEHPERDLVALDASAADRVLVLDRHHHTVAGVRVPGSRPLTVWMDAELAEVQRAAEAKFPSRSVELRDWDEGRHRFLVQVTGGTEPGRAFQFQRHEDLMVELMRSARWLPAAELHATDYFEFAGPGGAPLSGFLTRPRAPRLNPPPLIMWFAPGLPPQPHAEFDAQAQVLADMGFMVCRLNQRGVAGQGARHREALRRDPAGAPAVDALAAIDWIAARHRVDRKRVAVLGEGLAGHFALRAAQLHPEAFRCAVVFEPIINLWTWVQPPPDAAGPPSFTQEVNRIFLQGGGARLPELAATAHAAAWRSPVFVATRGDRHSATDQQIAAGVAQMKSQLSRRDIPWVAVQFNTDYVEGLPGARTRLYRELEEFFNLHLYNYDVKIGPTRVVR